MDLQSLVQVLPEVGRYERGVCDGENFSRLIVLVASFFLLLSAQEGYHMRGWADANNSEVTRIQMMGWG